MSTMIHDTDRCVNRELKIYRSLQSFQAGHINRANKFQTVTEKVLPILLKLLNIDPEVRIRLAGIKAQNTMGRYYHGTKVAQIDYRTRDIYFLKTLCHELVHAEQYHEGRLINTFDDRKRVWRFEWHGEKTNQGTTYKAYRNQPHEIEAWTRQESLAWDVVAELQRMGDKTFL